MAKGYKTGGRQKGTPNKETGDLFGLCVSKGLNVFERMVEIAAIESNADKQFSQLLEIAPYLYAKRKALEVSQNVDPEMLELAQHLASLSKEEVMAVISHEMKKLK